MGSVFLACFAGALLFLTVVFFAAYSKKRYDLIDSFWGPTFIVIALIALIKSSDPTPAGWVVGVLITLWGLRLFKHIFGRFLKSKTEDRRYIELRRNWPVRFQGAQAYIRIFVVQALLASLIALPAMATITSTATSSAYTIAGILLWVFGFTFEAIADYQLRQFIAVPENQGKLMTRGLWSYSRHPNYFGEIVLWWGIWLVSLGSSNSSLYLLIGPIVITGLLLFVSGIPLAERGASKRPGWEVYKKQTSILVPFFRLKR